MGGESSFALIFAGFLILSLASVGLSPAVAEARDAPQVSDTKTVWLQEDQPANATTGNNTSEIRHQDPYRVNEVSDIGGLERRLEIQLSLYLTESTTLLTLEEYEQAQALLGGRFENTLDKYVSVARHNQNSDVNETATTYRTTKESQVEFAESVTSYQTVYDSYVRAKNSGDEGRARLIARDLSVLEQRVNETSTTLLTDYDDLSNVTEANVTVPPVNVQNVTDRIATRQREITTNEFQRTLLTASATDPSTSFLDPITVRGVVTTENGTALANQTVVLTAGDQSVTAETDAAGRYTITHRPTTLQAGNATVEVQYLPDLSSAYLGTNTTVPVQVSPVSPTLQFSQQTNVTRLGDPVAVSGRVFVETVNAENVSVALTVGGTRIATTQTDANGTFSFAAPLPVDVPAGDQELAVSLPFRDRALSQVHARSTISVERTGSSLTIQGNQDDPTSVRLFGHLTTDTGRPVEDQPIDIVVDGVVVSSTRTGADGDYLATVSLPTATTKPNQTQITFVAVYDAANTNLAPARAETVAVYEPVAESRGPFVPVERGSPQAWFEFGSLLASIIVWRVARWNPYVVRWIETIRTGDALAQTGGGDLSDPVTASSLRWDEDAPSRAATLQQYVTTGQTELAVKTAYEDVRTRLTQVVSVRPNLTHWEFVVACSENGVSPAQLSELRRLTMLYELSMFDWQAVSAADATAAVEAFTRFERGLTATRPAGGF